MINGERSIPLSVPNFSGNELKYVSQAVEAEWVSTGGAYITRFEKNIADYVGVGGAVACQSGTAGLHTALMLCGGGQGQEVIVPALTFIAAVNPVKYVGAEPLFMDCDDSLCMDPVKLKEFCEKECIFEDGILRRKGSDKCIRCIIVVHVFGNMADMEAIMEIANTYNLKVIEDATEALGTYYTQGKYKGYYAGTIGNVGVYSFNGNKIITTGGGGMIVSRDEKLLKRAKHLTTQAKSDELYYEHDEVGYNYRMTNLQAALGVAQLEQLAGFIEVKTRNYAYYQMKLKHHKNYELLEMRTNVRSNYWFYSLYCLDADGKERDKLIRFLHDNGIQVRPVWGLINEQKPYVASYSYKIERAKKYRERIINVPCSTNLTYAEVDKVVDVLNQYK